MPERPRAHLDYDDRCAIEEGIAEHASASSIARRIDVSPSTVTREVKANRWSRARKSKSVRVSKKCGGFDTCRHRRDICADCAQTGQRYACKLCKLAVYCDPLSPGQKGSCERNHAELRRILPKGRSDFDLLSERDLALIASHINSYPRRSLAGRRPIDVARVVLPEGFPDLLGVTEIELEEVLLRPSLMGHAVEQ